MPAKFANTFPASRKSVKVSSEVHFDNKSLQLFEELVTVDSRMLWSQFIILFHFVQLYYKNKYDQSLGHLFFDAI